MTTILVVDDEPNNVTLLSLDLEDHGFDVVEACDGVEGWEKLEEYGKEIALILLDRMMPNMNGMEFMAKLKASEKFKDVPVIMQTAAASKEQVAEGIAAGVYYYMTKPYEEEVLFSVISAALQEYTDRGKLRNALKNHQQCFGMTTHCTWQFRTLDECRNMAPFIASYFPDPERVVTGISELCINAVEHGNLDITYDDKSDLNNKGGWQDEIERRLELPEYKDKKVTVTYSKSDAEITLEITDEGTGFDWEEYMEISSKRATDNHGRGIALSNLMSFDALEYVAPGNKAICRVSL